LQYRVTISHQTVYWPRWLRLAGLSFQGCLKRLRLPSIVHIEKEAISWRCHRHLGVHWPTRALGNGPLSAGTTSAGITSIAGTPLISCSRASAFREGPARAVDTLLPHHALSFLRARLRERRREPSEQEPSKCDSVCLDHRPLLLATLKHDRSVCGVAVKAVYELQPSDWPPCPLTVPGQGPFLGPFRRRIGLTISWEPKAALVEPPRQQTAAAGLRIS
jgi:hypothetical protein